MLIKNVDGTIKAIAGAYCLDCRTFYDYSGDSVHAAHNLVRYRATRVDDRYEILIFHAQDMAKKELYASFTPDAELEKQLKELVSDFVKKVVKKEAKQ